MLQALDAPELGGGMKKHGLHPSTHALEVPQQVQVMSHFRSRAEPKTQNVQLNFKLGLVVNAKIIGPTFHVLRSARNSALLVQVCSTAHPAAAAASLDFPSLGPQGAEQNMGT